MEDEKSSWISIYVASKLFTLRRDMEEIRRPSFIPSMLTSISSSLEIRVAIQVKWFLCTTTNGTWVVPFRICFAKIYYGRVSSGYLGASFCIFQLKTLEIWQNRKPWVLLDPTSASSHKFNYLEILQWEASKLLTTKWLATKLICVEHWRLGVREKIGTMQKLSGNISCRMALSTTVVVVVGDPNL